MLLNKLPETSPVYLSSQKYLTSLYLMKSVLTLKKAKLALQACKQYTWQHTLTLVFTSFLLVVVGSLRADFRTGLTQHAMTATVLLWPARLLSTSVAF
jgi:hypothetical protein